MLFVLTETWPATSSAEVGKEAVKLAGTPPMNLKMLGPFIIMGGDGVKDYTIYEVEKGLEDKSLAEIMGRLSKFFHIPGYKASLEVAISQIEALPLVGL